MIVIMTLQRDNIVVTKRVREGTKVRGSLPSLERNYLNK
jgi:hypothetical protein